MPRHPNQLANLRPVSRDPALASAQAKKTGFGTPNHPRCTHIKRNGERCKKVAAFGTPKCVTHGARLYKNTPPSPWKALSAALSYLGEKAPDMELQRQPAWLATENMRFRHQKPRQAQLAQAWDTLQKGNPEPWLRLTQKRHLKPTQKEMFTGDEI